MREAHVEVCVTGGVVVVRLVGRLTFVEAHPLRKFCLRMMEAGMPSYIFNAERCTAMDSTVIGVLAMVSLKGKGRGVKVEICGANKQVAGQILGLGLKRLFHFHDRCGPVDASEVLADRGKRSELQQTVLDAHETLVKADVENEHRFKDVLAYLREPAP